MTAQYYIFPSRATDIGGVPLVGGLLNFYEAGTLNRLTIYATEALTTTLSNPVESDAYGNFPQIFLATDDYDAVLTDADGVTVKEIDDIEIPVIPVLNSNYFSLIGGEYYPAIAVNNQTGTTYTVLNADRASMITFNNSSGGTITLPAPSGSNFPNKWYAYITNIGDGDFTISATSNINGSSTFNLPASAGTLVVSDGSTYSALAVTNYNQIFTKPGGTLTVTSNTITAGAFSEYLIDTSSSAQSIDTIDGGVAGKELVLKISSASNAATFTSGGNIAFPAGQDIELAALEDNILLRYDDVNSVWDVQAYQNSNSIVPADFSSKVPDAICSFNGAGTPAFIQNLNCTSITDNGAGDYTVNIPSVTTSSIVQLTMVTGNTTGTYGLQTQSAGSVRTYTKIDDGAAFDPTLVSITVYNVK